MTDQTRTNPARGLHASGTVLVVLVVTVMAIAAIVTGVFKPRPMSSIEVARQKQLLVYNNSDYCTEEQLVQMPQDAIDAYIEMLNYVLRINDSLAILMNSNQVDPDSEYTIAEANTKLIITALSQRETAARARVLQITGRNASAAIDSLYDLAHKPMPVFPQDSTAIRNRNLDIERYARQIFD